MAHLDIQQQADDLIQLIKTRFITPDGFLARNYPVTQRTLFDNFDDIVPFFIYLGETDFLLSQVHRIQQKKESLVSLCSDNGVLITRNIDEWFGGLFAIWEATHDQQVFSLLEDSIEFVNRHLIHNEFLSAAYYSQKDIWVSYYESWSSGLLETFCEMRDTFPSTFICAQSILRNWLMHDYVEKYALFPYRIYVSQPRQWIQNSLISYFPPIQSHSRPLTVQSGFKGVLRKVKFFLINGQYSQLMKSNSTCAFAMLEFYKATGDDFWRYHLLKWIDAATNCFIKKGVVHMEYTPKIRTLNSPSITAAFILVDIICDTVYFVQPEIQKNKYLSTVKTILDHAWNNRLENGLLPNSEFENFAHIDNQVDFAISLRRYAEITGDQNYAEKSQSLILKTLAVHNSPDGYVTYSGEVTKQIIDPKYNALLLKGMISLLTKDQKLYPDLYSLFKDR